MYTVQCKDKLLPLLMSFWFFTSYRACRKVHCSHRNAHSHPLQTLYTECRSTYMYTYGPARSTYLISSTHRMGLGQLTCLNETGLCGGYWRMGGLVRIWERGLGCTSNRPSSPNQPAPCHNIPINTHIHTVGPPKGSRLLTNNRQPIIIVRQVLEVLVCMYLNRTLTNNSTCINT